MSRRKPPTLLDCGHFADGERDGTPTCSICGDREARAKAQADLAEFKRQAEALAAKQGGADPTVPAPSKQTSDGGGDGGRVAATDLPPFVAGLRSMPDGEYHADPLRVHGSASLSGTSTRLLLPPNTPAHFRHRMLTPRTQPTAAMILGTAVHCLALGTADLDVFEDGKTWTSAAGREFLRKYDPDDGHAPILADDVRAARAMARNLREHPIAKLILEGEGETEQAMFAQHPDWGIWLRGKADKLAHLSRGRLVIADIKTTASSADAGEFVRTVGKYNYDTQAAQYQTIARILGLAKRVTVVFVLVESFEPYLVNVCEIRPTDMDLARDANEAAYQRFTRCMETGHWPGYPERIHPISLTPWDARAREEAIDIIDKENDPS